MEESELFDIRAVYTTEPDNGEDLPLEVTQPGNICIYNFCI